MKVGSIFDCSFPWWLLLRWLCNNEEVVNTSTLNVAKTFGNYSEKKQWERLYNMHLKG